MPVAPVQIFAGPEIGRRNEAVDRLKAQLSREWGEAPEEHRHYAGETGVNDLLSLLMNGSLFSAGKLVFCLGADAIKVKAETQALAAYARKPAERTVLLLVTEAFGIDKAIEDAVGKNGKQIFWELFEDEKERWIVDFFRREGVGLEAEACEAILELVENNTDALRTECSRLALFAKRGGIITESDVESYIAHNREEDAFSLFDRMCAGNFEDALEVLDAILAGRDGNGVGILGGLLWSFRRLAAIHELMTCGRQYEEAARSQRVTSRKLLSTYDAARKRWTAGTCRSLVAFGVDIDMSLRSMGAANERVLLELFVYGAMVRKGPVPLARC
ncbi:MAG: DNA polymerase III subunit delta [Spirochaetes bacterium]|nr:DNA polymerase III subunit delta [Spirochaetota bacterium]